MNRLGIIAVYCWASTIIFGAADYLRDIKPVLKARCYACHGALKQKSNLRLDTAANIRKGAKAGPVATPGKINESELITRITSKDLEERMPPEGEPLKSEEIAAIREWISDGMPAPTNEMPEIDPKNHWSFQPIKRPPIPALNPKSSFRNPIDNFIEAQRRNHNLTASPPAPKLVLLRRVYLDDRLDYSARGVVLLGSTNQGQSIFGKTRSSISWTSS